jgi:hypothetical protein
MMITVIAAVLAIVLTLALATRLNDASTRASTGVAGPPTAARASTSSHGWTVVPLAPLLSAPAAAPGAPTRP